MYNDPGEVEIRIENLKIGIREAEQAFVEKFPAGSDLLDIGCATGCQSSFEAGEIDMYFKEAKHMMKIIAASGHPDVPLAILFPDATGITGTHQPECKTRFVTCIERSRVYQQIMKKQYISSGRPQLNRFSQTEPLLRLLKI